MVKWNQDYSLVLEGGYKGATDLMRLQLLRKCINFRFPQNPFKINLKNEKRETISKSQSHHIPAQCLVVRIISVYHKPSEVSDISSTWSIFHPIRDKVKAHSKVRKPDRYKKTWT
jgi:hypothetical protein